MIEPEKDLRQYVDEAGLRLLVVAAPDALVIDHVQRTIEMILEGDLHSRTRVAIVGPMRERCALPHWGDRVLVADPVDLRLLATIVAGDPVNS